MSEAPRASGPHAEPKEVGPNYFGYCMHEIRELFSKNDDFLPSHSSLNSMASTITGADSSSLFSNGIGDGFSDFKRERVKASLKQSVIMLSQEVDEMLNPVLAMYRIQKHLKDKERLGSHPNASSDGDVSRSLCKKQSVSSPPSSIGIPVNAGTVGSESCEEASGSEELECNTDAISSEESRFNDLKRSFSDCNTTKPPEQKDEPAGPKSQSNTCGIKHKRKRISPQVFKGAEKENIEVNEDLQILLESGGSHAKKTLEKYSDELSAKLEHMEQQLEEFLDIVMSQCRKMTIMEMQQLQKLIQSLPPKNLGRIVEIIQRRNITGRPCNEIEIDLEKEDNATLWRLYYYVRAVESAKRHAS